MIDHDFCITENLSLILMSHKPLKTFKHSINTVFVGNFLTSTRGSLPKRAFGNLYTLLRGQNSNRLEGGKSSHNCHEQHFKRVSILHRAFFTRFKCDFTKLHTQLPVNSLVAAELSTAQLYGTNRL